MPQIFIEQILISRWQEELTGATDKPTPLTIIYKGMNHYNAVLSKLVRPPGSRQIKLDKNQTSVWKNLMLKTPTQNPKPDLIVNNNQDIAMEIDMEEKRTPEDKPTEPEIIHHPMEEDSTFEHQTSDEEEKHAENRSPASQNSRNTSQVLDNELEFSLRFDSRDTPQERAQLDLPHIKNFFNDLVLTHTEEAINKMAFESNITHKAAEQRMLKSARLEAIDWATNIQQYQEEDIEAFSDESYIHHCSPVVKSDRTTRSSNKQQKPSSPMHQLLSSDPTKSKMSEDDLLNRSNLLKESQQNLADMHVRLQNSPQWSGPTMEITNKLPTIASYQTWFVKNPQMFINIIKSCKYPILILKQYNISDLIQLGKQLYILYTLTVLQELLDQHNIDQDIANTARAWQTRLQCTTDINILFTLARRKKEWAALEKYNSNKYDIGKCRDVYGQKFL